VTGWKRWAADAVERAVKTFAQALLGAFVAQGVTISTIHWDIALIAAGTASLISVLTSLVSFPATGTASLVVKPDLSHGRHEAPGGPDA
jgi:hypothetical protein